jgi:hypothetical protein
MGCGSSKWTAHHQRRAGHVRERYAITARSNAARDGAFERARWPWPSRTPAAVGNTFGPYTFGEQTLIRGSLLAFGPVMLVLADRNFLYHALACDVLDRHAAAFRRRPLTALCS